MRRLDLQPQPGTEAFFWYHSIILFADLVLTAAAVVVVLATCAVVARYL